MARQGSLSWAVSDDINLRLQTVSGLAPTPLAPPFEKEAKGEGYEMRPLAAGEIN